MKDILIQSLANSLSYREYRKMVADLLARGKSTGHSQSDALTHYSMLNETRMNRLEKTITVPGNIALALQSLKKEYIWLVISEGWCGDAAQLLPVFYKMAAIANKTELRIVLRDDNEQLMNLFLTNGSRSIPKLILIDRATSEVLGDFGPRPLAARNLVEGYRAQYGVIDEALKKELQLWYLHDKGLSAQKEITDLLLAADKISKM